MRTHLRLTLALLAVLAGAGASPAQEEIDKAKAAAFDKRLFAAPLAPKTTYACFIRNYDAEHLAKHPKIARVIYPTLFQDPEQIRIYKAQCEYPGALLSLDLAGGKAAAFDFLRHLRITRNAVSLGGVESLACHPMTTTHSPLTEEEQDVAGVTAGLVRISVGIDLKTARFYDLPEKGK